MAVDKSNPAHSDSATPAPCGVPSLSPRHAGLIDEYLAIEAEDVRRAGALGFMARTLAQATLPHTDPKLPPGTLYSRETGRFTLSIAPTSRRYGIPFGTIPRMTLAWICTEAVRTKSPVLSLGRSQSEFLHKLNLASNGRDIARMREQCMRLFRAVIAVEYADGPVESSKRLLISKGDFVLWHEQPEMQSLWASELQLSEEFYSEATRNPVPIDLRVFHALSKSPLAMDIYTWLTYRMFVLNVASRKETRIPWVSLMPQLGANYADSEQGLRDFKKAFRLRLKEVLLFYPQANKHVEIQADHLRLTPAPLHIARQARLF